MNCPVLVISLERCRDRRLIMQAQLERLGLTYAFVDAVDGAEQRSDEDGTAVDQRGAVRILGRRLTPGEIACALSHMRVYQRIADRDAPCACVLEDDVVLSAAFPRLLAACSNAPMDWDLMFFAHRSLYRDSHVTGAETRHGHQRTLEEGYAVRKLAEFPLGAMGYLLRPSGARRLLQAHNPVRMPADYLTGCAEYIGLQVWALTPPIVMPGEANRNSTIGVRAYCAGQGVSRSGPLQRLARKAWIEGKRHGIIPLSYVWRFNRALWRDHRRLTK